MPVEFLGIAGADAVGAAEFDSSARWGGSQIAATGSRSPRSTRRRLPPAGRARRLPFARRIRRNGIPENFGSQRFLAAALLDCYDLGVQILSARGYDILDVAIDFGRDVIPPVRYDVARGDAASV